MSQVCIRPALSAQQSPNQQSPNQQSAISNQQSAISNLTIRIP
jgi:hypothetical protein